MTTIKPVSHELILYFAFYYYQYCKHTYLISLQEKHIHESIIFIFIENAVSLEKKLYNS